MLERAFENNFEYYCSQHRTLGCRITHMIGIPMLALTPVVWLVNRKAAGQLFKWGWALQMLGHYAFEHNKPVFLEMRNPFTLVSALIFVSGLWYRFFTGKSLTIKICDTEPSDRSDLRHRSV